jgi:DNA-binding response OmpR family regulator
MISELGYRVSSNTNPDAVIEEIKHGTFQIVVVDVSPPSDRALDLLARMRAADSDLCVISMTAMPTVDVAVRAMKQHAFDYLQKPVELEELRHVIDAAVREKGLLVDVGDAPQPDRRQAPARAPFGVHADAEAARQPHRTLGIADLTDRARQVRGLDVDALQARHRAPGADDLLLRDGVGRPRSRVSFADAIRGGGAAAARLVRARGDRARRPG